MLIVRRDSGDIVHSTVLDLPNQLSAGDVIVLNDSKSAPGVLKTRTIPTGAQVELRIAYLDGNYRAVARPWPTHFVKRGLTLRSPSGTILTVTEVDIPPHGLCTVETSNPLLETLKKEALPITSFFYSSYWKPEHYHPVYACAEGAVESPLAGLHFTWRLLQMLKERGIQVVFVTLHVAGSWLPFLEDDTREHDAPPERFFIPQATAAAIEKARLERHDVVAVGSTSMRALESAAQGDRLVAEGSGLSTLFIQPGHKFQVVDRYFTNFHPSRSSLLVLDAAFCPQPILLKAYQEAIEADYLFFEFGDAVLYA
jgi:S-adenosylmethionine:tRNA ribosyltransferase-isomerase